ncbi:MAG: AMP-binding protein [bacterium LCO1.1]|uniref:AMP-binding protein n=1 Tax=Candidatus Weimeria bifida TaxID=2599074 RepID=A0A6N7IY75_9FIRM|nr:AMP-binding protein [Candidatus Weimeria bifida]
MGIDMFAAVEGGHQTVLEDITAPEIPASVFDSAEEYHPGCLLFFTSGTTGSSKAVVLSQAALLRSAWNGSRCCLVTRKTGCFRCCHSPTFSDYLYAYLASFTGSVVQIGRGMRGFATDPRAYRPTVLAAVPSLLGFLLKTNALNPELRVILIGPVRAATNCLSRSRRWT